MEAGGISSGNVASSAAGHIYNMMLQQARTLAYVDTVQVLVVIIGCLIPIGYLMKKLAFPRQASGSSGVRRAIRP